MKSTLHVLVTSAAALGLAVPLAGCGGSDEGAVSKSTSPVEVSAPVPAQWQSQKNIRVGIACDYPPFGYTDLEGKNAGYDAEVGRALAGYAFGDESKVQFTCVTTQNRIPYLETSKIDLIISTLGYTQERTKTIDYSSPYFTSGAKLLVPSDSKITGWPQVPGQTIITKTGTTSSTFLGNCYKDSKQVLLDSTSDAVTALKDGRGVAFAEDSTLLLGLTLKDETLKVVGDDEATTPWGLGIRKGDAQTKKYVDAVLADMQKKDSFWGIFTKVVKDKQAVDAFSKNMPRPNQSLEYTNEDTLSKCP